MSLFDPKPTLNAGRQLTQVKTAAATPNGQKVSFLCGASSWIDSQEDVAHEGAAE